MDGYNRIPMTIPRNLRISCPGIHLARAANPQVSCFGQEPFQVGTTRTACNDVSCRDIAVHVNIITIFTGMGRVAKCGFRRFCDNGLIIMTRGGHNAIQIFDAANRTCMTGIALFRTGSRHNNDIIAMALADIDGFPCDCATVILQHIRCPGVIISGIICCCIHTLEHIAIHAGYISCKDNTVQSCTAREHCVANTGNRIGDYDIR